MDPNIILGYCDQIDALTQKIRDEVAGGGGGGITVSDPSDLQAALTAGGDVALEANLTCESGGGYKFNTPSTSLRGMGDNTVIGDTAPALRVEVGVHDIGIESLNVASSYHSVVRVGNNDTAQTTVDQAPRNIRISGVQSSGHRGKRAFEVNGSNVEIIRVQCA